MKLPYSSLICREVTKILNSINLQPSWFLLETTAHLFSRLKGRDDLLQNSGVVYLMSCGVCSTCTHYIGETKEYLRKRIYEQKYHICINFLTVNIVYLKCICLKFIQIFNQK